MRPHPRAHHLGRIKARGLGRGCDRAEARRHGRADEGADVARVLHAVKIQNVFAREVDVFGFRDGDFEHDPDAVLDGRQSLPETVGDDARAKAPLALISFYPVPRLGVGALRDEQIRDGKAHLEVALGKMRPFEKGRAGLLHEARIGRKTAPALYVGIGVALENFGSVVSVVRHDVVLGSLVARPSLARRSDFTGSKVLR